MNKRFVGLIAVVTAAAVFVIGGVASAEKPVTVVKGNIHTEFNGGFSPKTLSKKKLTPIAFWISGEVKARDGSHVPRLQKLLLEGDENVSISVKGIPVCETGLWSQQRLTLPEIRRICRKAVIGSGRMEAAIRLAEMAFPVKSELLALNGGFKDGVTTIYLHAYITVPTPAAIVTVVKVKRINKGRYGLQSVARIPKIAGGDGSVTFFKLRLKKGILSAKCPYGRLAARGTAEFKTPPPLKGAVVRPCTGRG